jgi:hypothetical protein
MSILKSTTMKKYFLCSIAICGMLLSAKAQVANSVIDSTNYIKKAKFVAELKAKEAAEIAQKNAEEKEKFAKSAEGKKIQELQQNELKEAQSKKEAFTKKILVEKAKLYKDSMDAEQTKADYEGRRLQNEAFAKKTQEQALPSKQNTAVPAAFSNVDTEAEMRKKKEIELRAAAMQTPADKRNIELQKLLHPNEQDVIEYTAKNKIVAQHIANKKYKIIIYRDQPTAEKVQIHFDGKNSASIFFNGLKSGANYIFPGHQFKLEMQKIMDENGGNFEHEILQGLDQIIYIALDANSNILMRNYEGTLLFTLSEIQ